MGSQERSRAADILCTCVMNLFTYKWSSVSRVRGSAGARYCSVPFPGSFCSGGLANQNPQLPFRGSLWSAHHILRLNQGFLKTSADKCGSSSGPEGILATGAWTSAEMLLCFAVCRPGQIYMFDDGAFVDFGMFSTA